MASYILGWNQTRTETSSKSELMRDEGDGVRKVGKSRKKKE